MHIKPTQALDGIEIHDLPSKYPYPTSKIVSKLPLIFNVLQYFALCS